MARRIDLALAVGAECTVPLAGAGAAGYEWSLAADGGPGAVHAEIGPAEPPRSGGTGGSVPQRLVVRGVARGAVRLRLRLARPWEADAARDEVEVHVSVGD